MRDAQVCESLTREGSSFKMRLDGGLKTFREKIKSSIEGILNNALFIYEIIVCRRYTDHQSARNQINPWES